MSLKFSKNENKNFFINLIIINLFFLVPLYLFGINHYEEGYYHYFSLEASYLTCFLRPDYPLTGIFELK